MKQKYQKPIAGVIVPDRCDIITASADSDDLCAVPGAWFDDIYR